MTPSDYYKKDINFINEIETQSDRGAAILLASWLEEELGDCLRSKFIDSQKNNLQVFNANGPLSTFSSKIELSYLMGFISEKNYKNLKKIKNIRNDFAHSVLDKHLNSMSFESDSIKDRCYSLDSISGESFNSARHAFSRNCAYIHADISLEKDFNYYSLTRHPN